MEERLDKLLMERGLVSSRTRGEELIKNGDVLVNGITIDKPGKKVSRDAAIVLLNEELTWVSRGALKLLKAIEVFGINPQQKTYVDVGASTGGFTEVLLKHEANKVYCVDVGHAQLHERIKNDARIVNLEKTHIRELTTHQVPEKADGIVIDVSFISLEKVIPFTTPFIQSGGDLVVLIKPQFELDKKSLNKHGVVRSSTFYPGVIDKIKQIAISSNYKVIQVIESPIVGGDGNKEFLMHCIKS